MLPSLHEMVTLNPVLYDALRERDSAANHVCELLVRNGQVREALHVYKKAVRHVDAQVRVAVRKWSSLKVKENAPPPEPKRTSKKPLLPTPTSKGRRNGPNVDRQ
jgi:hypothetical protein